MLHIRRDVSLTDHVLRFQIQIHVILQLLWNLWRGCVYNWSIKNSNTIVLTIEKRQRLPCHRTTNDLGNDAYEVITYFYSAQGFYVVMWFCWPDQSESAEQDFVGMLLGDACVLYFFFVCKRSGKRLLMYLNFLLKNPIQNYWYLIILFHCKNARISCVTGKTEIDNITTSGVINFEENSLFYHIHASVM